ncbi:MAG TPA: L,D-transpeptidase family protein [Sphingomonas sp.]|jgi:lipoprotein-anchoring transpeptidase ErfK/SrfK|uniref:L,D-transpeptidase family protein n=1 Tax=Sphingomonas sp. TaxID=28214 RepID=UPI002ED8D377
MANVKTLLACAGLALAAAFGAALALAPSHRAPEPIVDIPAAPRPARKAPPPIRSAAKPPAAEPAAKAEAPEPYVIRHILPVPGVMRIGDTYWDETGAPAGPIVVTIDLQAKVLSIFRAGYEIGTAAIIYGGDDKPTPLGVFPITEKDADHVSNIYHAPMPYMQRLTDDGISIHGSPRMEPGLMTHGCVGVPTDFARRLFKATKIGDKVVVTNGERLDIGKAVTAF